MYVCRCISLCLFDLTKCWLLVAVFYIKWNYYLGKYKKYEAKLPKSPYQFYSYYQQQNTDMEEAWGLELTVVGVTKKENTKTTKKCVSVIYICELLLLLLLLVISLLFYFAYLPICMCVYCETKIYIIFFFYLPRCVWVIYVHYFSALNLFLSLLLLYCVNREIKQNQKGPGKMVWGCAKHNTCRKNYEIISQNKC